MTKLYKVTYDELYSVDYPLKAFIMYSDITKVNEVGLKYNMKESDKLCCLAFTIIDEKRWLLAKLKWNLNG